MCEGILRRTEERGRKLPDFLERILTIRANGGGPIVETVSPERFQHTHISHVGTGGDQVPTQLYEPDGIYATSRADFHTRATKNVIGCLARTDYHDGSQVAAPIGEHAYVMRRLTPLEYSRLQGFPDSWCDDLVNENPDEEEISFWKSVWSIWMDSQGKKRKTEKQIKTWLASEPTDNARYQMFGNGVALPCVDFVLSRIVAAHNKYSN